MHETLETARETLRVPRAPGAEPTLTAPSATLSPGVVIGSYRIVEQIGQGGVGEVFLAEHVHLGRRVALKVLRSEHASSKAVVRRFFEEGRAVNRIAHENIVEITDFVEDSSGRSYIVMELLAGETLSARLERVGPLSVERAIPIGLQICSALDAAHRAGIVHRDLKPDNVFLTSRAGRDDFVKVLDFGVAKIVGEPVLPDASSPQPRPGHTAQGVLVGTPEYMSPEQATGSSVDLRADVYAFGVMLYEALTGHRPFLGKDLGETLQRHLRTRPPSPTLVAEQPIPAALEALVLQCLEKDPSRRPQDMREIARALEALQPRASLPAAQSPPRRRGRLALGLAIGLAIAASAALAGSQLRATRAPVASERSIDAPRAEIPAAEAPPIAAAPVPLPASPVPPPSAPVASAEPASPKGAAPARASAKKRDRKKEKQKTRPAPRPSLDRDATLDPF
ncbi:MAG: serine/threonine protein kinase [Deltaproteobacteria bacterium]|nr:serine/threonine protein kinase [Deltaproteobacteria bacterium]